MTKTCIGRNKILVATLVAGLGTVTGAGQADATSITVLNWSFETPVHEPNGGFGGPVYDWNGSGGTFNPGIGSDVYEVPNGQQVVYMDIGPGLTQDLGVVSEAGTEYTLTVYVGTQINYTGGGYLVRLLSGTTVLGQASGTLPRLSHFQQLTITGTGTGVGNLIVNLQSTSGQPLFDAVEVQSQTSVLEPASMALLGAGLVGLGMVRRRRG